MWKWSRFRLFRKRLAPLDHRPGLVRQVARQLAEFLGALGAGIAQHAAPEDALADRSEPEQAEGHEEGPVLDRRPPDPAAVSKVYAVLAELCCVATQVKFVPGMDAFKIDEMPKKRAQVWLAATVTTADCTTAAWSTGTRKLLEGRWAYFRPPP